MKINVSQQLKASIGEVREYETNGAVSIDNTDIEIKGKVRLTRIDDGILVEGKINSGIGLTCGRCLSEFTHNLNLNIQEIYYPTTDINTGVIIDAPNEPGCFTIDANNILDLSDAVNQYALMALPIKPLCSQECAGLCSTCGTNLNDKDCGCPTLPTDPRWDSLRKLVLMDNNESVNDMKGSL
ncbi:DUF177 domain-containing protein [Chloroflexota bacterium]